ncbi:hypothetical protein VIBNIAM115_1440047 [Vibrio nigripulchritudo AM115]|nr:hypothetical protein VIBNIAM115_1440047 [Vibrio nigripulchritudo AM115]
MHISVCKVGRQVNRLHTCTEKKVDGESLFVTEIRSETNKLQTHSSGNGAYACGSIRI